MCDPADVITTANEVSDLVADNLLRQSQTESAGRFRSRKALLLKWFVFRNGVQSTHWNKVK